MAVENPSEVTNKILAHYDANARDLPWRSPPGAPTMEPYRVWLSEIMLQQTTVAAVKPYFERFLTCWPTVADLAAAEDGDVMQQWAGLGYYARARNLLACARTVMRVHDGKFPQDEITLRTLPGVGEYTAAAITSIAFGQRAVVVDGNVERVIARFHAVEDMMPKAKPALKKLADALTPVQRAGDFAQAMMDLGATICTPRSPACGICPLMAWCKGRTSPERYPVKPAKAAKPARQGTAWWIERGDDVLLVRRPDNGLLGGMLALPSCDWRGLSVAAPFEASWVHVGDVRHVFTHFSFELRLMSTKIDAATPCNAEQALGGEWWSIDRLAQAGLPSLFAKAVTVALAGRDTA
jgi:A/G-specific adenine glycosylase